MKQNYLKKLMTVLLLLCSTVVSAQSFELDGIYYNILSYEDKTVKVTSNSNKYTGDVTIPQSVIYDGTTYSVTSIGDEAFFYCTGLTSIVIPNSVITIGDYAFAYCRGLTSIVIPNSVITIGDYAFAYCRGLTSVTIGNGVTRIGQSAFYCCAGLTSIEIPSSVASIGNAAFYDCTGLTSIVVDEGNTVYDSRDNCNAIVETATNTLVAGCRETIITNTIAKIESGAFYFSYGNNSIISIAETAPIINEDSFSGETPILYKPTNSDYSSWKNYVSEIRDFSGQCGDNLYWSFDLASRALTITGCGEMAASYESEYPWYGFRTITENLYLPEGLTNIPEGAFNDFRKIKEITIPASVVKIGGDSIVYASVQNGYGIPANYSLTPFICCTGLEKITVKSGNTVYYSDGNAIIEKETKKLILGCKETIIPSDVLIIGEMAFWYCSELKSIDIPYGVKRIEYYAFTGIYSLESVTIPESVEYIGGVAFGGSKIKNFSIPASVKFIGTSAFHVTPWYEQQPDGLLYLDNCLIDIKGNNYPTSLAIDKTTRIVVPSYYFSELENITVDSDNPYLDSREDCNAIINKETNTLVLGSSNTVIPYSVTTIGEWAFAHSKKINTIIIPNNVIAIEEEAFSCCSSLTSIEIPSSVTSIGDYAFYNCSGLTSITSHIPADKLFVPGSAAFNGIDKTNCTLYVPAGAKATYAATDGWSDFTNIVELAPSFDLTVSAAGYATMFLDYAVEIPTGVEVYTANRIENDFLIMQPVEGAIPANTGVIVRANEGTYSFVESSETPAAVSDNLLTGTVAATYVKPAAATAYVLSKVDGVVGMYRAKLNADGTFKNNANKAYMLLSDISTGEGNLDTSDPGAQLSAGYRFDFSGFTGVESVEAEGTAPAVYYDLSGRRVENPVKGIYILNGHKVFIK